MSSQNQAPNLNSYKIVLMGDSGVGKTSIVNRYTLNEFKNNILASSGVGFTSKLLTFSDINESCKLEVIIII
jgi:GTPase SAR1 family protein